MDEKKREFYTEENPSGPWSRARIVIFLPFTK